MVTISISSLAAYFGFLSWSWPKTPDNAKSVSHFSYLDMVLIIVPVMHFLIAAMAYSLGYFAVVPAGKELSSTILEEYGRTKQRRVLWLIFGGTLLWLGVTSALSVLFDFMTSGQLIFSKPLTLGSVMIRRSET